jgi:hypothetical protein
MEGTAHPRDAPNCSRLASCWIPAVLEMAFKSPVEGRPQACEQRNSSLDFSNGCRESNVGSCPSSKCAVRSSLFRTNNILGRPKAGCLWEVTMLHQVRWPARSVDEEQDLADSRDLAARAISLRVSLRQTPHVQGEA